MEKRTLMTVAGAITLTVLASTSALAVNFHGAGGRQPGEVGTFSPTATLDGVVPRVVTIYVDEPAPATIASDLSTPVAGAVAPLDVVAPGSDVTPAPGADPTVAPEPEATGPDPTTAPEASATLEWSSETTEANSEPSGFDAVKEREKHETGETRETSDNNGGSDHGDD